MFEKINKDDISHVWEQIVSVPNVSQKTLEILDDPEYWRKRSCAVSCLNFSMNHYWVPFDSKNIPELSKKDFKFLDLNNWEEKLYKYFTKETWWNNYAILELARNEWLTWKVYNKKFEWKKDFYNFLNNFESSWIFMVSVNFRWDIDDIIEVWSHLVTIVWFSWTNIYVKNPYDTHDMREYNIDEFVAALKWNIIYITDNKTEEFLSFSPIRFENNNLIQNDDNFLRIEIEEWVYVKFLKSDFLNKTTEELLWFINIKLDINQKEIFKRKINFLRKYFIKHYMNEKKYFKDNI
jgi:hypothetical protein